jgi:hypothetical protein
MKAMALDEVEVCLIGRCPVRVRDGSCLLSVLVPRTPRPWVEPLCGRETTSSMMDATGSWTVVGRRFRARRQGQDSSILQSSRPVTCTAQGRSRCCGEALLSLSRRTTGSTQRERLRGRSTLAGAGGWQAVPAVGGAGA